MIYWAEGYAIFKTTTGALQQWERVMVYCLEGGRALGATTRQVPLRSCCHERTDSRQDRKDFSGMLAGAGGQRGLNRSIECRVICPPNVVQDTASYDVCCGT
jgi:hypothetical protein